MVNNDWIKELKVGDSVWQIERHPKIPDGFHKCKGVVVKIEPNYIEVKWMREPTAYIEDLRREMKKNSVGNMDATYNFQFTKNYFSPDGSINIEKID